MILLVSRFLHHIGFGCEFERNFVIDEVEVTVEDLDLMASEVGDHGLRVVVALLGFGEDSSLRVFIHRSENS